MLRFWTDRSVYSSQEPHGPHRQDRARHRRDLRHRPRDRARARPRRRRGHRVGPRCGARRRDGGGDRGRGRRARFVAADLGDLESVARLAEEAHDVDVLVNNAGVFAFMPTADQDVDSYESMFDINVRGTFFLTAALAPKMAARGEGSIVNITTMAAEVGMVGGAAYGASKAALASLTRSWAAEYAAAGVRVNAVSPGPTTTKGTTEAMGAEGIAERQLHRPAQPPRDDRRDRARRRLHRLPAGQLRHRRDVRRRRGARRGLIASVSPGSPVRAGRTRAARRARAPRAAPRSGSRTGSWSCVSGRPAPRT